jgi:hypothetical protein
LVALDERSELERMVTMDGGDGLEVALVGAKQFRENEVVALRNMDLEACQVGELAEET